MEGSIVRYRQIALFSDFGSEGPYIGQVMGVLYGSGVKQPIYELLSDAPAFSPKPAAYLLAALAQYFTVPTLVFAVVDPGVGGARIPILVRAGDHCFIGPDNGLLSRLIAAEGSASICALNWRPDLLSSSFHGRDLFAPVLAMIAKGEVVSSTPLAADQIQGADWATDLLEVIYLDHYGNAVCGLRASELNETTLIGIANERLPNANTFCKTGIGAAFWYANSMGLVEIAVNQGRAVEELGLKIGDKISIR